MEGICYRTIRKKNLRRNSMSKVKEIVDKIKRLINHFGQCLIEHLPILKKVGHLLKMLTPSRYIGILDWYIIKKFIGTYIYAILLLLLCSTLMRISQNSHNIMPHGVQSYLITMLTLFLTILTSSHHCLFLLPLSSLLPNWLVTLR